VWTNRDEEARPRITEEARESDKLSNPESGKEETSGWTNRVGEARPKTTEEACESDELFNPEAGKEETSGWTNRVGEARPKTTEEALRFCSPIDKIEETLSRASVEEGRENCSPICNLEDTLVATFCGPNQIEGNTIAFPEPIQIKGAIKSISS
jgi:hypothetical protein